MTKINSNLKSVIARHLINNNSKSLTRKGGFLTTTVFNSKDDRFLGVQSIAHYIENKPIKSSETHYYNNKNITKTVYINREIFNKFPKELCKQIIIITQELKNFSNLKKTFSLPTSTEITKFTIFKDSNSVRKEVFENKLISHYTPWDKPQYTHKTSEEILPYKENSLNQFGMF